MELALQHDSQLAIYRKNLEDLSLLLAQYGYTVKPYNDSSLEAYKSLDPYTQLDVSRAVDAYLYTLRSEFVNGSFSQERFVLQFLFRMGILPSEDLADTVKNERYIQIYNSDQIQIFRSLACYERCSFTLEQMTTRPWFELWERESLFYYACFGLAATALKIMKFTRLRLDFPHHKVTEIDSFENYTFDYKIKSLSALTRQGKLQAALLVEDWKY